MQEFLRNVFASDFMAHGYCYLWRPEILWLHVLSDALITLAYYSIPVTLVYFVSKRRDLPFHWIFFMFGAFILSCGTTHAMEVWTVWHGTYRLAGVIKLITAGLSITTAIASVVLVPQAMALPSPGHLAAVNRELEQEIRSRQRADWEIKELNESLERRVRERTAQLALANQELQNEIRQRKRAEERFRLAVESAPSAMVMASHEGEIVLVNSETERLFGYGREELLGQPIEILAPESLRASHSALRHAFLAAPRVRPMGVGRDLHAQRKDGSQFPVEIALSPIETDEGTWVLSSIVDITFHRQKLESVGVLAGGIAHDFNNLLGSILSDTELALSDLANGSSPADALQSIRAVSIRAAEIVRELMIYAGQEKAHREPVDVSRLVQEMLELLKVSISKHAIVDTDLGCDLPFVMGNAPQIRQVLMNLILNASEALGTRDGAIHITTSGVKGGPELAPDNATQLPVADYLRMEVSDTGRGMSKEEISKMFDPFFSTKFAGRGLGLAVVQGIVRAHGGAINVSSVYGQGTTFQIFWPCACELAKRERVAEGAATEQPPIAVSGTVLLVEDEETLRSSIAKMLRRKGYSVVEAADGSTAIELFRADAAKIDQVLLDLTLPGASSREVIAEVGRIKPDTRLILTSAYELERVFSPSEIPESASFIRKPFQLSDLQKLLQDRRSAKTIAGI